MFTFKSKRSILPLAQGIEEKDDLSEQTSMLDDEYLQSESQSRSWRLWSSNIPWILTTVALSAYILFFTQPIKKSDTQWSPTDVVYARHLIDESFTTFTTGLDYNNANHTLQHTLSDGLRYVGPPGPEIDAAWEAIAGMQETFLTKEEAIASKVENTYISPLTGLYVVEVESFHHLHCLNYIRKSLDLDDYPDIKEQQTWRTHVEHCINSIREFIMCKADMTPIVLVPPEEAGVPVPVPEFRTTHVCRNFEKIHSWVQRERIANLPDEESLEVAKKIRESTGTKY